MEQEPKSFNELTDTLLGKDFIPANQAELEYLPKSIETTVKPMLPFSLKVPKGSSFTIQTRQGNNGIFHNIYLQSIGWTRIHIGTIIQNKDNFKIWKSRFHIEMNGEVIDMLNIFKMKSVGNS